MQKYNSDFYLTAKKLWDTVVKTDSIGSNELKLQLELHKRLFNIFQVGSYYYLLFNIYEGKIAYISPEITNVMGYAPAEVDIFHFMNSIHPQDKPYFLFFEEQAITFFKSLAFDKIKNYKMQYDLRIKSKSIIASTIVKKPNHIRKYYFIPVCKFLMVERIRNSPF